MDISGALRPIRDMRRLKFKRRVYAGFAASILLIIVTAAFFQERLNHILDHTRIWMRHSVDAAAALDSLDRQNNRLEAEMLRFMKAGDPVHLELVWKDQLNIAAALVRLSEHLREMGFGSAAAADLHASFNRRDDAYTRVVRQWAERQEISPAQLEALQPDRQHLAQRIALLKRSILLKRAAELDAQHEAITNTRYLALAGLATTLCFLLVLIGYITKTFDAQKKAERFVREANADLNRFSKEKEVENWILNGLAALDNRTRGGLDEHTIAANAIQTVCQHLDAKVGLMYLRSADREEVFVHAGSYAAATQHIRPEITRDQGVTGECIASGKQLVLRNIPENYLTAVSALGSVSPESTLIQPFVYEGEVLGVMELGFFHPISDAVTKFAERAGVTLAVALKVARAHATLTRLYEETQKQAEALEAQQEELQTVNTQLEEKARLLQERHSYIEQARLSIAVKARELEQSGKYKSEFLANMSHELRTPLNSILILAKLLEDNKGGNLLPEQLKYASVIHHAGTDLLNLINNVLDLAKIESGNVELMIEPVELANVVHDMQELFSSVAGSKAIGFSARISEGAPTTIATDEQRLRQVLKNLLSNAFKFTPQNGRVELTVGWSDQHEMVAVAAADNGIGIPTEKQQLIFEAFKQADGSTSRRFGGTGLGLSICRELATMLGGSIDLISQEGKGSTFTLYLPLQHTTPAPGAPPAALVDLDPAGAARSGYYGEAEKAGLNGAKKVLIIESDKHFSDVLEAHARAQGCATLVAHRGDAGLRLAFEQRPDAIILDADTPVIDGRTVLRKLKRNPDTRDIPVCFTSSNGPDADELEQIEADFLQKPFTAQSLDEVFSRLLSPVAIPSSIYRPASAGYNIRPYPSFAATAVKLQGDQLLNGKRILLADDDMRNIFALTSIFASHNLHVETACTGMEALEKLQQAPRVDLVLMDIMMPGIDGYEAIARIRAEEQLTGLPIIAITAKAMEVDRQRALEAGANDYIPKPVDIGNLLSLMRVWLS